MSDLRELRLLNFRDLVRITHPDVTSYTFDDCRRNEFKHPNIVAYCTSCDDQGWNLAANDPTYRLTIVSHGAHSSDFFLALTSPIDLTGWHQEPVVFVYETPSGDDRSCSEIPFAGHKKKPSKDWYWIHNEHALCSYPDNFRGGEYGYGHFVLSAVVTFRLANVYMTNLVKCSMNNMAGKFKPLNWFRPECIKNCYEKFLSHELAILQPVIVFAVGASVENYLRKFCRDGYRIQQLPHPAGQQRGLRDEHYKVLYFWLVLKGLRDAMIVSKDEYLRLAEDFYRKFKVGPNKAAAPDGGNDLAP